MREGRGSRGEREKRKVNPMIEREWEKLKEKEKEREKEEEGESEGSSEEEDVRGE